MNNISQYNFGSQSVTLDQDELGNCRVALDRSYTSGSHDGALELSFPGWVNMLLDFLNGKA